MANYVDTHLDKIQTTPGGKLCQVFGHDEKANCSVAIVKMEQNNKGIKHYHDNITEIYIFAKGKGKIVINENENKVGEGDCYIITPNTSHYIEAIEEMNFICICTPPWEEKHEFIVNETKIGKNITKFNKYGILQSLSNDINHNITRIKINNNFIPNNEVFKFRRVYYFISGKGSIIINNKEHKIEPGYCYEVNQEEKEIIIPITEIDFVSIYDKF